MTARTGGGCAPRHRGGAAPSRSGAHGAGPFRSGARGGARAAGGGAAAPLRAVALAATCLALAAPSAAQWGGTSGPVAAWQSKGDAMVVVAVRGIPSRTVLTERDLTLAPGTAGSGLGAIDEAVGLEVRSGLQAGKPVRPEDLSPPALVERNDIVRLSYERGGLSITAEGRALDRGAFGDRVRVMNLESRQTVSGSVAGPGAVAVSR